jgi:hypothetical protein
MEAGDRLSSVMLVITELGAGACVHPSPSFYCQRAAVELSISDALLASTARIAGAQTQARSEISQMTREPPTNHFRSYSLP